MTAIDETDQRILTMLEADGRATLAQLAQATGLSVSAAQSRVQKLEKRGIIKGYKAIIDQEQRGLPISAFVNVTPLDYSVESSIPDKLNNIDGIVSCYSVAGAPSFVLVVRVASPTALEELLNLIHRTVPVSTETTMILRPLRRTIPNGHIRHHPSPPLCPLYERTFGVMQLPFRPDSRTDRHPAIAEKSNKRKLEPPHNHADSFPVIRARLYAARACAHRIKPS